ncbi:MAG: M20/M25/M40 family metallo-hydrolase [Ignavibacteriales bacterium]
MTPEAEVDLLKTMCSIYSPPGEEGEIASYLVERMRRLGWNSYVDGAGNAVGESGDGPETIMLLGHMDTVPGFIPVEVRDGLLYGRGAVDAKGPLAAFVCAAARSTAATTAGRRRRIVVVGAVGEETDESPGASHLVRSGGRPDFCIIGEPGGWSSVTLGYRGRLAVEAVVRQSVGHPASGRPSVLEIVVDLWERVAEWARTWPVAAGPGDTGLAGAGGGDVRPGGVRQFDRLGVVLRDIRRESDHFQESARLSMDFRLPPDFAPGRLSAELTERFPAAEFQFRGGQPAWRGGKGNPLVRAFVNSIREQGGNPGFKLKLGTSDMNVVAPAWNCPIVAFGPGDPSLDHTPGEHLSIREYQSSIGILSRVLETL